MTPSRNLSTLAYASPVTGPSSAYADDVRCTLRASWPALECCMQRADTAVTGTIQDRLQYAMLYT